MVDFELGPAVAASLVGGGVMIIMLYGGIAMMPDRMRMNLLLMLGGMMGMTGGGAYLVGLMMHAMMSVIFGAIHAAVFASGDIEDGVLLWGVLFGAAHALVTGTMLAGMPMMHPLIRAGRMEAPGLLAIKLGGSTAMDFVMLHMVFGALVAVLYAAWI